MSAIQPVSSAPLSGLIWELDSGADLVFGDSPFDASPTTPPASAAFGKKLASVFDYLRSTVWPAIMDSANMTQIQIIYRSQTIDPSDVLNVTTVETSFDIYGTITGASAKNIERGFVIATDFECLVAADDLSWVPTARRDAVRFDGVTYDIVGVLPCPNIPSPVGYRFFLRRAL